MRLGFDLDNTLCVTLRTDYMGAIPCWSVIERVNALYDAGHHITIDTARGSGTGEDWYDRTRRQLSLWGVKYHVLRTGVKLPFDQYIGDEAINVNAWMAER